MRPTAWSISPLDSIRGSVPPSFSLPIFFPILSVCKWQWKKDSGLFPFPNFGALRKNNFFFAWRASAYFLPISLVPHSFLFLFEEDDWNPSGKHENTSLCLLCDRHMFALSIQIPAFPLYWSSSRELFTITAGESVKLKYDQEGFSSKTTKKHDLWSEEEWFKVLEPALES